MTPVARRQGVRSQAQQGLGGQLRLVLHGRVVQRRLLVLAPSFDISLGTHQEPDDFI